ncbi:MAG: hypothetical protein ABI171_12450 [Collimonas sp.]|uniref:hypothetical protein n=1 Tax=Collimonas sp. TaxID=1963772 RepID=UPI003267980D
MPELKHIAEKRTQLHKKSGLASGNGRSYANAMEARVNKLEEFAIDTRERLSRIETRLDACATKSDIKDLESTMYKEFSVMHKEFAAMHKDLHGLTWKLIGAAGVLVSVVYFIATQVQP